jgi:chorismate mutase/prephenate dehydratase
MKTLAEIRAEIDHIDQALLVLLNQRAECVLEVAAIKKSQGFTRAEFYQPAREEAILTALIAANTGPLQEADLRKIFLTIMAVSTALQLKECE